MAPHLLPRLLTVFTTFILSSAIAATPGQFSFRDDPGRSLEVLSDGRAVARYMYSGDVSTPEKRLENYKPYLHVLDAEGREPITKGPGGDYPHHRGIFLGWSKLTVGDKVYDRWHMKGGEQFHREFLLQESGAAGARFTSRVEWMGEDAAPVLVEERSLSFLPTPGIGYAWIEMSSKLKAVAGETKLNGDPEHSGLQFRPASDVQRSETVYFFPKKDANAHADRDYPWVGQSFSLRGKRYSVVYFNHPQNPKGTAFSADRNYGRFGAWFRDTIPQGGERTLRVRFLIVDGEMPSVELLTRLSNDFGGVQEPVPVLSVKPAETPAAAPAKPASKPTPSATPSTAP